MDVLVSGIPGDHQPDRRHILKVIRQQMSPEFVASFWNARYPGQIPEHLVLAEELKGNVIDLEGCDLVVVEVGHTDTDHTTCLHQLGFLAANKSSVQGHATKAPVGLCVVGSPVVFGSNGHMIIQCGPTVIAGLVLSLGSESLGVATALAFGNRSRRAPTPKK